MSLNLTPTQKTTTTLGVICAVSFFIWQSSKAWGEKADKSEVDALKDRVSEISTQRREDAVINKNILALLEKMDKRMERIEDTQNVTFQAIIKGNQPFNQLPLRSGENPLNR